MNLLSSPAMYTAESADNKTTMEGILRDANGILDKALSPKTKGIPKQLFRKSVGIILITMVEGGFIFSGNVGTGVILRRKRRGGGDDSDGDDWSPPCACGLKGVGFGLLAGAAMREILVFVLDDAAMEAMVADGDDDAGLKVGGQVSLTVGSFGRDYSGDLHLSGRGVGATATVAMSKGVFGGVALESAVVKVRQDVNQAYYHHVPDVTARQILLEDNAVQPKEGSLMPEIYRKLDLLSEGATAEPADLKES